jgi:rubrerythrin
MRTRLRRIAMRRRRRRERHSHHQRAHEAERPKDLTTYTCSCGYLWEGPVSTTVACPHCGADQAW